MSRQQLEAYNADQPVLPGLEEAAPNQAVTAIPEVHEHHDSHVVAEEAPDATDRWLEEIGGGGREEVIAIRAAHRVTRAVTPKKTRRNHYRGSYNEGSDSELDPWWNAPAGPRPADHEEVTARGVALAEAALRPGLEKRLMEQAEGDERRYRALLRAYEERHDKK